MPTPPSFETLKIGDAPPPLTQAVEAATLVRYAGASEDYAHQHWDHVYMTERGFPGVIIHGWLTFAYVMRTVTDWIPREAADVGSFAVRYHRTMGPGAVHCSALVVDKRDAGGRREVDLEVQARNDGGDVTTSGKITLVFP